MNLVVYSSFVAGMLWITMMYAERDIKTNHLNEREGGLTSNSVKHNDFLSDVINHHFEHQAIQAVYFAFTTMSTVGFGDLHPITNTERLLGVVLMIFGVSIFSYVMGSFISHIATINAFYNDFEEQASLFKFIGTLKKFNKGSEISPKYVTELEAYFDYYWSHNLLLAFGKDDYNIWMQLSKELINDVFYKFLQNDFLKVFHNFIRIEI